MLVFPDVGHYQPIPTNGGVLQSEVVPELRFRLEDLNSTPMRWVGWPSARYLSA
jgi:hypothetical protein